jgi:hypothetical protein
MSKVNKLWKIELKCTFCSRFVLLMNQKYAK